MTNPEAPATYRQLFALWRITKEDHRDMSLTKQQASDLISKYNSEKEDADDTEEGEETLTATKKKTAVKAKPAEKEKQPSLSKFLLSDENIERLYSALDMEITLGSVVGIGCGFANIEIRGKGKKYGENILNLAAKLIPAMNEKVRAKFSPKELTKLEKAGTPLLSYLTQNLGYRAEIMTIIQEYMTLRGIEDTHIVMD